MKEIRHFLSLDDYSKEEIIQLMDRASELKHGLKTRSNDKPLEGKSVGIIFEKPSTRTRVSFHVGVLQLGGHAILMNSKDIQLGRGEPIKDTARVLSRYLDAIVIRTFGHEKLEEFAKWSTVPIINGLSDFLHPCQILSDVLTAREAGLDIFVMNAAWIGDGNNVANSWINAAKKIGFSLKLACPEGYDPGAPFESENITLLRDPKEAAKGANLISTDVWSSMGQEDETEIRQKRFKGFQVNREIMSVAGNPCYVLHCLPAHRGEEITDEVIESSQSLVWEQAENRLHVQKAILEFLIG
ncbi:MAG: ornithine carbamoyltransferase [Syntrophaceae bacterium]|nr:ornithine carbamoyltransferase [Syntrophaceae bacterium]